jgi:hypothetical protein
MILIYVPYEESAKIVPVENKVKPAGVLFRTQLPLWGVVETDPVTYKREVPAIVSPGRKFDVLKFATKRIEPIAVKVAGTLDPAAVLCVLPSLKRMSPPRTVTGISFLLKQRRQPEHQTQQ